MGEGETFLLKVWKKRGGQLLTSLQPNSPQTCNFLCSLVWPAFSWPQEENAQVWLGLFAPVWVWSHFAALQFGVGLPSCGLQITCSSFTSNMCLEFGQFSSSSLVHSTWQKHLAGNGVVRPKLACGKHMGMVVHLRWTPVGFAFSSIGILSQIFCCHLSSQDPVFHMALELLSKFCCYATQRISKFAFCYHRWYA